MPIYIVASDPQSVRLAGEEKNGFISNETNQAKIKDVWKSAFEEILKQELNSMIEEMGKETGKEKMLFIPASCDEEKALN